MTSDRNNASAGFWITVALAAVLVGYPLSFGPACWVTSRMAGPHPVFEATYVPLGWTAEKIGSSAWTLLNRYAQLGMPPDQFLRVRGGGPLPTAIGNFPTGFH